MTNEELDEVRAEEAWRQAKKGEDAALVAARLAREGWMPVAVDPDLAEARELFESWANNDEPTPENVVLRAIKRGRELERAETAPGMVWVKHDRSEKSPVNGDIWVLTRNYDPETAYAMAYSCNRAHKRLWQYVTHYTIITRPEDVA